MNLQTLSVMALWGAAVLYAIAMFGYAIRLARVADAKVLSAQLVTVGGGDAPAPTQAASGRDTTAERDPAPAAKALGIARSSTMVGIILHGIGVLTRGIEAGHVPWSNMYEYSISGSLAAVGIFLLVQRKRDITFLGAGITGLATIALGLGLTVLYAAPDSLPPALQSFWLIIHVSIATICSGIFGVSFIVTSLQLLRDYRDSEPRVVRNRVLRAVHGAGVRLVKGRALRFLEAVPTAPKLEALAFRLIAVGFVLWTFTVMAGSIWAEHAWGRYWGWDPKEIWSFVIWVVYAAYLHARTTQGWAGRKSAYLALAGFGSLIVNFTLVNYVFQGLHTYAGPGA